MADDLGYDDDVEEYLFDLEKDPAEKITSLSNENKMYKN